MKKAILILFLFAIAGTAFAQQSNYQSKVYINGKPANGQHLIQFRIPAISWVSTQDSIFITNGLFSTMIKYPNNLFDEAHDFREMIVNLDGNDIDTVTVNAPLERDPTVRSYIRDSINWPDIHHKPTFDTIPQTLSLKGDSLNISNGNTIKLPGNGGGGPLTVNGEFKVIDTSIQLSLSFTGLGYTASTVGAIDQSFWQSFQATGSGKLRQLNIPVAVVNNVNCNGNFITVNIYSGTGNTGQALGYKSCPVSNTLSFQTLDLTSGVISSAQGFITLQTSKIYTFQVTPPVGCQIHVGYNSSNPYQDGISSIGANTDIVFDLSTDNSSPSSFTVAKNGYVGIGTDKPTAQLEVNGRIKDQTGYLMPVGSVVAYAGSTIPDGWLLCDGRMLNQSNYPDLFKAVGNIWGKPDSVSFNLPDMRGFFLRGVDDSPTEGSSLRDPDRASRVQSATGGSAGNNVGSVQSDSIEIHDHFVISSVSTNDGSVSTTNSVSMRSIYGTSWAYTLGNVSNRPDIGRSSLTGGNETRPKNVYVYYIIKY